MMPRCAPPWRRNTPHSAGDSVSAFSAEISMATQIVTANCWNSTPDSPGMKAIGTNTDSSTRVMAMIGPVICVIASRVASRGGMSGCSPITRSTFSTTTMASSTTMPIASTSASSETVLAENPSASHAGEGADQADRDRDGGDDGGAQAAQEQEHHHDHERERLDQRLQHLAHRVAHEVGAVVGDVVGEFGREAVRQAVHQLGDRRCGVERVGAGGQIDRQRHRGLAVVARFGVERLRPELDPRHVAQTQHRSI